MSKATKKFCLFYISLIISVCFSSGIYARIIKIPVDFTTIQAGIDKASDGDTVLIKDGIYFENIQIIGKQIVIGSYYVIDQNEAHIANTVIDGSQPLDPEKGSVIAVLGGNNPYLSPQIIGLTITGGCGWQIQQSVDTPAGTEIIERYVGGGVYIERMNPVFTMNRIVDNMIVENNLLKRKKSKGENQGGGVYAYQSAPSFGGTTNDSTINQGGNIFAGNFAQVGKTIFIESTIDNQPIHADNCFFDVFNYNDTSVSQYWAVSNGAITFDNSKGFRPAIKQDVYVSATGSNDSSGLYSDAPFKTIEYALSQIYGDSLHPVTIHVAEGIYSPSKTDEIYPLQMISWVSLSGAGNELTVLDAEADELNPGRVLLFQSVINTTTENLTITGGYVDTWLAGGFGGGIYIRNSNPTIRHATISRNSAGAGGGGIFCFDNSKPKFSDIKIVDNSADYQGGGLYCFASSPYIENSSISNNTAKYSSGGGIYCAYYSNAKFVNLTISQNNSYDYGGGVYCHNASPIFEKVKIVDNKSYNGAGIYFNSSEAKVVNSTIINNYATNMGGGIFCFNNAHPTISNTSIMFNNAHEAGGGIYCFASSPILERVTVSENQAGAYGGALAVNLSTPIVVNSVFWSNLPDEIRSASESQLFNSKVFIAFSDIMNGIQKSDIQTLEWLDGNINKDPLFVHSSEGGYSIQQQSPAIDAGVAYFEFEGMVLANVKANEYHGNAPDMGAIESDYSTAIDNSGLQTISSTLIYPNPMTDNAVIKFTLDYKTDVMVLITNTLGQVLKSFYLHTSGGSVELEWDGSSENGSKLPAGVYFCKVAANNFMVTQSFVIKN